MPGEMFKESDSIKILSLRRLPPRPGRGRLQL
jgi:hypothetical protein